MPTSPPTQWTLIQRLRASYYPGRSGDFYVVGKPHVTPIADTSRNVATHGSPWDYDRRVPILFATQTLSLTQAAGRTTGALLQSNGTRIAVRSRGGVILATGGFSQNAAMRRRLLPPALCPHSPVAEGAQGDGIAVGQAAGARLSSSDDGNGSVHSGNFHSLMIVL